MGLICLTSATDCIAYDIPVFGKRLRSSVARNMEQPSKSDFRARNIVKQEANSGGKVNGCIVHAGGGLERAKSCVHNISMAPCGNKLKKVGGFQGCH